MSAGFRDICDNIVTALATWPHVWNIPIRKRSLRGRRPVNESLKNGNSHHDVAVAMDWRIKMSYHIACALLVYTALQIFVTVHALEGGGHSVLPYLALVVLVAGIIPACRWFEKRWDVLTDEQAVDPSYQAAFKSDIARLWLLSIGLPFLLTGLFMGIAALF